MKKNLKTTLFGHILRKSTHSFLGAWSLLLVHVWFTSSERPKALRKYFFHESDYGSVTTEK